MLHGEAFLHQAKETGINCLRRKHIQQGAPVSAHLINQQHPHRLTAEGHGKKSNRGIMPVIGFLPRHHDNDYQQ